MRGDPDLAHLPAADLPAALAEVHRVLRVGGQFELAVFATAPNTPTTEELSAAASVDDLLGRRFTWWDPEHLRAVIEAAGFALDRLNLVPARHQGLNPRLEVTATALRALPDHVGADMALLCCGLNPSLHAADAGVGYVSGSNRFWRALALATQPTRRHPHLRPSQHQRPQRAGVPRRAVRPPPDGGRRPLVTDQSRLVP